MNSAKKIIDAYYNSFKNNCHFDKNLFCSDFKFQGPLKEYDNLENFMNDMQQFSQGITGIEIRASFFNENEACIIADLITVAPFQGTTSYAELFTLQDNKIKSIELIYDAREWARVMNG